MAKYNEYTEATAYRFYLTDQLYYLAEGKRTKTRFYDLLKRASNPVDVRSGNEIASDVINRLGLKFEDGD